MSWMFLGGALLLAVAVPCLAATITDGEAAQHVGQTDTVCGPVASVYYASRSRARPTFLDFGTDYPHETFTAVVFGRDRAAFGNLADLRGQRACVTGTIELYHGRPEIILREPSQLKARG